VKFLHLLNYFPTHTKKFNQHTQQISSGSSAAVYIWHGAAGAAVPGTSAVAMSVSCISLAT